MGRASTQRASDRNNIWCGLDHRPAAEFVVVAHFRGAGGVASTAASLEVGDEVFDRSLCEMSFGLEPSRDALVQRLRAELGDQFVVPDAPRLPYLNRGDA